MAPYFHHQRNLDAFASMDNEKRPYYHFNYMVVVDFEATCEENTEGFVHEIIQFPAVLIDMETHEIVDEFNSYCKPSLNPTLSPFCTSLTGITQNIVDSAKLFQEVLVEFEEWLRSHGLGTLYTFSLVTDGSYDMGKFLYTQCQLSGIEYPMYAYQWIDIRLTFFHYYGIKWYKLPVMLELIGEKFSGTLHNGLDDSKNIGKLLIKLLRDGANPIQNEKIILELDEQEKNLPSHRFGLRTVKLIHAREFFASRRRQQYSIMNYEVCPPPSRPTWSQRVQQGLNKENHRRRDSHHFRPQNPVTSTDQQQRTRVNKLKAALREATRNDNVETSHADVVPKIIGHSDTIVGV